MRQKCHFGRHFSSICYIWTVSKYQGWGQVLRPRKWQKQISLPLFQSSPHFSFWCPDFKVVFNTFVVPPYQTSHTLWFNVNSWINRILKFFVVVKSGRRQPPLQVVFSWGKGKASPPINLGSNVNGLVPAMDMKRLVWMLNLQGFCCHCARWFQHQLRERKGWNQPTFDLWGIPFSHQ